jgi:hypothetical protein
MANEPVEALKRQGRAIVDRLRTNVVPQTLVSHPICSVVAAAAISWIVWKGPRRLGPPKEADDASGTAQEREGSVTGAGEISGLPGKPGGGCEPLSDRLKAMVENKPLTAASSALALGMVVGLSLPGTDLEGRWVGPWRDRFFSRIRTALREMAANAWETSGHPHAGALDESGGNR